MKKDQLLYTLGAGQVSIGTGLFIGAFGILTFQHLKNKMKLGAKPKKSELTGIASNILFSSVSDIDNLIERLLDLRNKVEKANAADDKPVRCFDEPRKTSRKGKKR